MAENFSGEATNLVGFWCPGAGEKMGEITGEIPGFLEKSLDFLEKSLICLGEIPGFVWEKSQIHCRKVFDA